MAYIKRSKKNGKVYLSEVESKRVNGKVVTKHIRYIGKEVDGETVLSSSISDVSIEEVKVFGPLLVLDSIAKEIGLHELLGDYSGEILSMVYAHCLDYKSVSRMPQWFGRTDLNMILGLANVTEERLLEALDSLESKDAEGLQRDIFNAACKHHKIDRKGIVYDVTNTYLHGKKCPLAKPGKSKEGPRGKPLIQVGLAVTQKEGIPVIHKTFPGNTNDSRTFREFVTLLRQFNINKGLVVFDRGVTSNRNQLDIKELNWDVVCGLPLTEGVKKAILPTIEEEKFIKIENRVKLKNSVFYVKCIEHSVGKVKGRIAICFNERHRRDLNESRFDEILNAQSELRKGAEIKPGLAKFFLKNGELNSKKIEQAGEFDGYSVIFTTKKISNDKLVRIYFDKDIVERAFKTLKGVTQLRPIRHWLYDRVQAHVFICYLSYLLLTLLKLKLQKLDISPSEALTQVESLYKIYMKDKKKLFSIHKVVALNKTQEAILRAVNKKLLKECRG